MATPQEGAELREQLLEHFIDGAPNYATANEYQQASARMKADEILPLIKARDERRERRTENYGRIASLLELLQWLKLHDIEDVTMVQDYVRHVETSIKQSPNQRYVEHPELRFALANPQELDKEEE